MKKLLTGLILSMLTVTSAVAGHYPQRPHPGHYPQHPHPGYYQHYYTRPYYNNNWYWAAPLALGVVTGYVISNSHDQPQLRRDADGRLYELRNLYFDDCRCYKQVWVQIQ